MSGLSIILHPTDFSEGAMAAYRMACRIARDGMRLVVLHVLEESLVSREGYLETMNRRLRELEPPSPGVTLEIIPREGHAVDEILRAAEDLSCDLIVMGSHGKTGLFDRPMGGVAGGVLRRSKYPVLLVASPPPPGSPEEEAAAHRQQHVYVF